jgi:uncharacterized UBP type Zn finger protein
MASSTTSGCTHYTAEPVTPSGAKCEECDSTEALRVCTTCGHVGCCESQQGHNTAHSTSSGHPVIKSLPLDENSFTWCYACEAYV